MKNLSEPKELTQEEKKKIEIEYFEDWFGKEKIFFRQWHQAITDKYYAIAAFYLPQTTGNLYQCSHLVLTNYRQIIHNIEKLAKVSWCFSRKHRRKRKCFDLLKRSYAESRCSKDYSITTEQLEYFIIKVEELKKIVNCKRGL
jgi:hypothetical protein